MQRANLNLDQPEARYVEFSWHRIDTITLAERSLDILPGLEDNLIFSLPLSAVIFHI